MSKIDSLIGNSPVTRALSDLKALLYSEKEWVKVHVAEYLLWEGQFVEDIKAEFLKEEQKFGHTPKYRIGIWRVLAQVSEDDVERGKWIGKIANAYHEVNGEDRLHAIETLAKLKQPLEPNYALLVHIKTHQVDAFTIYSLWNAAYHPSYGVSKVQGIYLDLLLSPDFDEKLVPTISYALRSLGPLDPEEWQKFYGRAELNRDNTVAYASLLATTWILAPEHAPLKAIKSSLLELTDGRASLIHVFSAIACRGTAGERKQLLQLYGRARDTSQPEYDADTHACAAYAIITLSHRMAPK